MNRKSLVGLFVCNFVVFSYGNGFLPLMPLYAAKFGASGEVAGYYIAFAYLCLAAGTILGGRLSDAFRSRRALLAVCGALAVPFTWLLGNAASIWELALINGVQWLLLGACIAVIGAIAGREAGAHERGRVFGVIGTAISAGAVLGGLSVGRIADAWGYPALLSAAAVFMALIPASALLAVRESPGADRSGEVTRTAAKAPLVSAGLLLLIAAQILTTVSNGEGILGRTLAMSAASFTGTAITATAAVGGVVSLPLPFLAGWLSDRVGRKPVLVAGPLIGAASLLVLVVSRSWWQFCVAAGLNSLLVIGVGVGPAIVADVVDRERVGTGISLFQSSIWVGMILGFSSSGAAFQHLGMPLGLESGAAVALLAVPLFLLIGRAGARRAAAGL